VFVYSPLLFATDRDAVTTEYRESIASKGPGAWLTEKYIYFSVDKVCIRKQKYSGTKETRAATAELLFNIGEHFQSEFYTKTIKPDILKNRLKIKLIQLNQQHTNVFNMSGMLVADEDIGNCTRRRTMAFEIESYNNAKQSMKTIDIEALKHDVIEEAFVSNDREFLAAYSFQLGMLESYISFSIAETSSIMTKLNNNLNVSAIKKAKKYREQLQHKISTFKGKNNCSDNCLLDKNITASPLDITSVITTLKAFNGLVLIDKTNVDQQHIAKEYFQRAENNFNQGTHPEQIYKDLSISLLFNPNQVIALNMMGSIARTLNMPDSALILHNRALMLSPKLSTTLSHIAKTHLQLGHKVEASIYVQFIINYYQWLLPDTWAKTETARLAKDLK